MARRFQAHLTHNTFKVLLSASLLIFTSTYLSGENVVSQSKWDKGLLQLELKDVHVRANSINEAWQRMADKTGIRTILYVSYEQQPLQKVKFSFDSEKCTAEELLKAFEQTYSGYIHTQDKIGVIWLHPQNVAYGTILTNQVVINRDALSLPMATGILDQFRVLNIYPGCDRGTASLNTFDYPVDLQAGVYSIRDILNICCLANPDRTFYVHFGHHGIFIITPLTVLLYNATHPVTLGALSYWQSEIDNSMQKGPTEDQLIAALSSKDARIRFAARNYVDMNLYLTAMSTDRLLSKTNSIEQLMWVAVGSISISTRTDLGVNHLPAIDRMEKALKESDWSKILGLKVLVAVELARVEKDSSYLKQVADIPLSQAENENVKPDIIRNLRYSEFVRTNLLSLNPSWNGFSKPENEALGSTNIFIFP